MRDIGLGNVSHSQIESTRKDLKEQELKLRKYRWEAKRQRGRRGKKKAALVEVCEGNKDAASILKLSNRSALGRPRVEVDQSELLSAIVDIVSASSAMDDRRHCEQLRTVRTLDKLVGEQKKKGFTFSRSAIYLRLVPRGGNTS